MRILRSSGTRFTHAAVLCAAVILGIHAAGPVAAAPAAVTLDELLDAVANGRARDSADNEQRLQEFRNNRASQQQQLNALIAEERELESQSIANEEQFATNEAALADLQKQLHERLGSLRELFDVLQLVASDAHGVFSNSVVQLHYPERSEWLLDFAARMGQTSELPSISEIERLWFELQREMTESGKVVRWRHPVLTAGGTEHTADVIRVGTFNLVGNDRYLYFVPETGRILELPRQPQSRYLIGAADLTAAREGNVQFSVDPVRGQLLSLLVRAPTLTERIEQGGLIGYFIIALGGLVLIVAAQRLGSLTLTDIKISRQMRSIDQPADNPLGRVLRVYHGNRHADLEALELRLGEAVMREVPIILRGLPFLKIAAAVAPLMGLLGTVTGMIITFQAITLFGSGDPKLMANGISQALVTTVLGLTVAIPTLLIHNFVQVRARKITDLLSQEAISIVAAQAEAVRAPGGAGAQAA